MRGDGDVDEINSTSSRPTTRGGGSLEPYPTREAGDEMSAVELNGMGPELTGVARDEGGLGATSPELV